MKAFITSIGEPTTDLCAWSLQRLGYEPVIIEGTDTLAEKLVKIYSLATGDFIRVDADVIVNRNLQDLSPFRNQYVWWYQFICFDWYKMDITHGGVHLIKDEALPYLRLHAKEFLQAYRPETELYRLKEFYEPRRCISYYGKLMGLHGYKQDNIQRVKLLKESRNQLDNYDFELYEKVSQL